MMPQPPTDRFPRLEGRSGEFPFFNGQSGSLTGRQWMFVMAMTLLAFLVLALPIPWPGGSLGGFIPAVLFVVIPLAALAYVAGRHWTTLFGPVGAREVRLMIGFGLLNLVISLLVGGAVSALTDVTANSRVADLAGLGIVDRVIFFAKTLPQLLGEEVITLLPFLALLHLLSRHCGVGRRRAIVGAWLLSSLIFGLLHLPTYDWNWIQCLVIIGSARMVLTLPWILTKNLWVSTGAHIVNDWLLFVVTLAGAGAAGMH